MLFEGQLVIKDYTKISDRSSYVQNLTFVHIHNYYKIHYNIQNILLLSILLHTHTHIYCLLLLSILLHTHTCMHAYIYSIYIYIYIYTLKNAVLNTTQCWVNKYWTEHMLGCFQQTVWLNVYPNLLGSNPTAGSKQPKRWIRPHFTQRWVVFYPAFFRVYTVYIVYYYYYYYLYFYTHTHTHTHTHIIAIYILDLYYICVYRPHIFIFM